MIDHVLVRRGATVRPERPAPAGAVAVIVPPLVFAVVVTALTATQYEYLRGHGWQVTDHRAVPWPSALATGANGWLLIASFALLGVALLALARPVRAVLPRTQAARVTAAAVATQGLGLCLAAFPIDGPVGDANTLTSWIHSWHATVHVTGFLLAGVGAVVGAGALALAARRAPGWRALARFSALCCPVMLAALVASVAPAWYVFLLLDLAWIVAVGLRVQATPASS
jgi:hypothetical protein